MFGVCLLAGTREALQKVSHLKAGRQMVKVSKLPSFLIKGVVQFPTAPPGPNVRARGFVFVFIPSWWSCTTSVRQWASICAREKESVCGRESEWVRVSVRIFMCVSGIGERERVCEYMWECERERKRYVFVWVWTRQREIDCRERARETEREGVRQKERERVLVWVRPSVLVWGSGLSSFYIMERNLPDWGHKASP